jgi:hypothetical protein
MNLFLCKQSAMQFNPLHCLMSKEARIHRQKAVSYRRNGDENEI